MRIKERLTVVVYIFCCVVVWITSHGRYRVKALEIANATSRTTTASVDVDDNDRRPTMHTFFERIPVEDRYTGMTDEDDDVLLEFWKQAWTDAGWKIRVLTRADAMRAPLYPQFKLLLDKLQLDPLSSLLLERWMAMAGAGIITTSAAVGGGANSSNGLWMADYDVFPLRPYGKFYTAQEEESKGTMTLLDNLSPTLSYGNSTEWQRMAMTLVEDGQEHCQYAQNQQQQQQERKNQEKQPLYNFWTDSLGLIHALRKNTTGRVISKRLILPGHVAMSEPNVTSQSCWLRSHRFNLAVHFGPGAMQGGQYIPPHLRLPQHRVTIAKQWLAPWNQLCNSKRK